VSPHFGPAWKTSRIVRQRLRATKPAIAETPPATIASDNKMLKFALIWSMTPEDVRENVFDGTIAFLAGAGRNRFLD
jgi:hypothetical protein